MKSSPEPLSWRCGGPRLEWIFGDLVGSFRCSSIFWITSGSVIAEMTAIFPPQTLQVSMSILKTRLSSWAQVMRFFFVESFLMLSSWLWSTAPWFGVVAGGVGTMSFLYL